MAAETLLHSCTSCNLSFEVADKVIPCDVCDNIYHHKCSGLSEICLRILSDHMFISWKCFSCRYRKHRLANMASEIDELKSEFKALKLEFSAHTKQTIPKKVSFADAISANLVPEMGKSKDTTQQVATSIGEVTVQNQPVNSSRFNGGSVAKPDVPPRHPPRIIGSPDTPTSKFSGRKNVSVNVSRPGVPAAEGADSETDADGFTKITHKLKSRRKGTIFGSNTVVSDECSFSGVPRRVNLYVGDVNKSTTSEEIVNYLRRKFPSSDFECSTLNCGRIYNSFVVTAPMKLLNVLLKSKTWPDNVSIGKYFPPKKSLVSQQPVVPPVISKSELSATSVESLPLNGINSNQTDSSEDLTATPVSS